MLLAISPIDGRYKNITTPFQTYFSEFGLIRFRIKVEIEYLICLIKKLDICELTDESEHQLRDIFDSFDLNEASIIKEIERTTNHDVKAVEYYIKEKLVNLGFDSLKEWVHFGLTSQDINNTAIPISLKFATQNILISTIEQIINNINLIAIKWQHVPMLARTHGQPATPTGLGKELYVFVERLNIQIKKLIELEYYAKFGGATGNFNAHFVAYPEVNWIEFATEFLEEKLTLKRSKHTTQIEHYDNFAEYCHCLIRINTILIDFCRDVWTYISMEYFKQKSIKGEVGSSAMPHKVNPIDFENAEGNLGIANALLSFFAEKLPISRLQRDLTDSTVLRNIGVPISHLFIALKSIEKGINKLELNEAKIKSDLDNNWMVVAEAIQTILRRENYENPYEKLKDLTRGNAQVNKATFLQFIEELDVSEKVKTELKNITPSNYVGNAIRFLD